MTDRSEWKNLIDGKFCSAVEGRTVVSSNPADGEILGAFPRSGRVDVEHAVAAARKAFCAQDWRRQTFRDRAQILLEIASLIEENAPRLAELITRDMGKPIKESSLIEVPSAAAVFRDFATMGDALSGETLPHDLDLFSYTIYEPLGVVGLITPWNYPLLMAAWKLAPALAAGNTAVLKPSEFASLPVLALAQLLGKSSLPSGVVNVVTGLGCESGLALVEHNDVDKVFFTGGTASGREVLTACARAVRPAVVELGGKSPTILCADAPLESSIGSILTTAFMNQGAMCVAGSRLFIERPVYDEAVRLLIARASKLRIGRGLSPQTDMGPLITKDHRDRIAASVDAAVRAGAKLRLGGSIPTSPELGIGSYYPPTILSDVTRSMPIYNEELFGPVLLLFPFDSLDEAIRMANDSDYGLSATVWTSSIATASRVSRELDVGTVWVNSYGNFAAQVPFGGFKRSGFGKELGRDGLRSYCRQKSVTMDISADRSPLVSRWYGS